MDIICPHCLKLLEGVTWTQRINNVDSEKTLYKCHNCLILTNENKFYVAYINGEVAYAESILLINDNYYGLYVDYEDKITELDIICSDYYASLIKLDYSIPWDIFSLDDTKRVILRLLKMKAFL